MKTRCTYLMAGLFLLLTVSSCKDDEAFASIIGRWQGDKAQFSIKPDGFPLGVPYTVDFASTLEFKADGALILTQDGKATSGTYTMVGKKLTLNIDFSISDISLAGTYTIRELSDSRLKGEIEKTDTVKNPETGADVSGKVKATLTFNRI